MKKNTIEGKDPNRVPKFYDQYVNDWNNQYDMLLMDTVTCKSCSNCDRCVSMFGQKEIDTFCQFFPNRFNSINKK